MQCVYPVLYVKLDAVIDEKQLRYMCFSYAPHIVECQWIKPLEIKIRFDTIENAAEAGYHLRNEWGFRVLQDSSFT